MQLYILATFDSILTAIVYLAASFVLFLVGKFAYKLFHPKIQIDHELVEKDNVAFAVEQVGYYIGLLLAIGSAIYGDHGTHLVDNLIDIALFGVIAIILLNVSIFFTDFALLRHFNVKKEIIEDQNAGTGVVQGAVSVGVGIILFDVLAENSDHIFEMLILWAITMVLLVLAGFVYNLITPYNIHDEIEKDNVAVGVGFAGALIAMANLVGYGASIEAESWLETLENLGLETGFGLILLPIARLATDKILLPKRSLTDELVNQEKPNIGAAFIEAFAYIGGSVLIIWNFG